MPQSFALRAAALLAPLLAATLGCEGQPSTESQTSPASAASLCQRPTSLTKARPQ